VVEAICGDARTKECLLEAEAGELLEAVDKVKRPFVGILGPRSVYWRPRPENFWRL
jgi:hypothetical protein